MLLRIKPLKPLVDEILDQLPEEVWISSTTTFLDPAMGGGQFVSAIERRLAAHGHARDNIASRVFGYEHNLFLVDLARNMYKLVGQYSKRSYNELLDSGFDMKFDVIVGNPPYNSEDTLRDDKAHRGQGDNLAKKFVMMSIDMCTERMAMIMPYGNRTYSSQVAEHYRKSGLYAIKRCTAFKNISQTVGVFYFDRTRNVDIVSDDFLIADEIPEDNITKNYHVQPGRLNRIDYENQLADQGTYQICVTTSVIKYTDDPSIVDKMQDRTRGHWRTVVNTTSSMKNLGKVIVVGPDACLSKSVNAFVMADRGSAERLKAYLELPFVDELLSKVKTSSSNSAKFLRYIPSP